MVAVADSGSNTSSQYLVNTAIAILLLASALYQSVKKEVTQKGTGCISALLDRNPSDLHADLPAPDGPMRSILRVGRESSEAMIAVIPNNEILGLKSE